MFNQAILIYSFNRKYSLPPVNEVWGKVIFSVAYQEFCSQRGGGGRSVSVHAGIPPLPEQAPPGTRHPPGAGTPSVQCMLGDTVNKRAVCILLECNLVCMKNSKLNLVTCDFIS